MKYGTVNNLAMERCPITSLSPDHYRDDNTCLCMVRLPERSDEQLRADAEEMLARRPAHWPAVDHDEWVAAFVEAGRILSGRVIGGE